MVVPGVRLMAKAPVRRLAPVVFLAATFAAGSFIAAAVFAAGFLAAALGARLAAATARIP